MNKKKWIIALGLCALCCILIAFACWYGRKINITVSDSGKQTEVTIRAHKTIQDALDEAGIQLKDGDEISEDVETKLTEDTTLTIARKASVTVVYGEDQYEETLVGGTINDVIEKTGIELAEDDYIDEPMETYLADGMTITVHHPITVKLTVDGKTKKYTTETTRVQNFLDEQGVKLGKHDRINKKTTRKLKDGMKIVINRVKIKKVKETQTIAFSTSYQNSSSLASGKTKVKRNGVNGEKVITYKVTYVDGEEESRKVVKETVTKKPVSKIILKGTKKVSSGKKVVSRVNYDDCDGSGHGVTIIRYSDGSTKQIKY